MAHRKSRNKKKQSLPAKSEALEGDILSGLPEEKREIIASMFSGPLPHPNEFNQYPEEVQKTIVANSTKQMNHRHKMETKIVDSDALAVKIGAYGTLVIYLISVSGAIYLMASGKTVEGVLVGFTTAAAKALVLFRSNGAEKSPEKTEK